MPAHVRKGDTVMVTSGAHKGAIGEITRVNTKTSSLIIKGINLSTKHIRPSQTAPQGGIITKEMPIHMSKVSPVVDGKPVRVGFRTEADGSKVRVARHGGKDIKVLSVVHGPRAATGTKGNAPVAKAASKPAAKVAAPKPVASKPAAAKAPKAAKAAKSESAPKAEKAPKAAPKATKEKAAKK